MFHSMSSARYGFTNAMLPFENCSLMSFRSCLFGDTVFLPGEVPGELPGALTWRHNATLFGSSVADVQPRCTAGGRPSMGVPLRCGRLGRRAPPLGEPSH